MRKKDCREGRLLHTNEPNELINQEARLAASISKERGVRLRIPNPESFLTIVMQFIFPSYYQAKFVIASFSGPPGKFTLTVLKILIFTTVSGLRSIIFASATKNATESMKGLCVLGTPFPDGCIWNVRSLRFRVVDAWSRFDFKRLRFMDS